MIASRRAPKVRARYQLLGGGSPLEGWTVKQANLLRDAVQSIPPNAIVDYAMRYTSPLIGEKFAELKRKGVNSILILPMFPHYTEAMNGSIISEAEIHARRLDLNVRTIPAWGDHPAIIQLQKSYLAKVLAEVDRPARVLFVAHGIPQRSVRIGENYPDRVRLNAGKIMNGLSGFEEWVVSFQSRLGPVAWVRPYLEDEITRLCKLDKPLVLMPLSFVADCLETIYDLDIVTAETVAKAKVQCFKRVPAFNDDPALAKALAQVVKDFLAEGSSHL